MSSNDLLLAYNLHTEYKLGGQSSVYVFYVEDINTDSDEDYYTNKKTKSSKSLNIRKKNIINNNTK